ncbi:transcription elongation factor GreA [Marmoricola sp. OAE513]|uniref:transcription elongation factor GreA n=1 Tax=Marmoricola sp. OAE513 TaxID=2817894 RepID=UPI001AEABB64
MTQADERDGVWLTQSKFDELTAELEELRGPGRTAVVEKVSQARDEGDLKENGGYHAAREELGKLDGRIAQLVEMLKNARVGEKPADDGVVEPGMLVTIRFVGDSDTEEFLLGAREMAGEGVQVYSPQSPMGEAINGHKKGETVTYTAPNGKELQIEIVEAVPYDG